MQYEIEGSGGLQGGNGVSYQGRTVSGLQTSWLMPSSKIVMTVAPKLAGTKVLQQVAPGETGKQARQYAGTIAMTLSTSLTDKANKVDSFTFSGVGYSGGTIGRGLAEVVAYLEANGYLVRPMEG